MAKNNRSKNGIPPSMAFTTGRDGRPFVSIDQR